jgi:hypothetical protein
VTAAPRRSIEGPIAALDPPWPVAGAPVNRRFYIRADHWGVILGMAAVAALAPVSFYESDSLWIGVGIFVAVAVAAHTLLAGRVIPWIPGLISLMAIIQWVLAPWAGYHMIPEQPVFTMALPASVYFAYAVPAVGLFTIGLYLPLWRRGQNLPSRQLTNVPAAFRQTCDGMIAIGFLCTALENHIPFVLRYFFLLLGYLAFVGAFGALLVRAPGWAWRVVAVLALRAALSTSEGMFHDLLLWSAYCGALLIFMFRPKATTILAATVVAVFMVGVLNEAKLTYRKVVALSPEMPLGDRLSLLGNELASGAADPTGTFSGDPLTRMVTRLNQGWIIARVMVWTPTSEPFAHGETIMTALRAAVLPRFLDPNKYTAGGAVNFPRFTGLTLVRATSMNLSPAGEMYANFGITGGLIGMLVFGYLLGMLYRVFAVWSEGSQLWWAWAPYVMLYTMQAENGLGEAINHVAKSSIVMMAVVYTVPAWNALRRWHRRRSA